MKILILLFCVSVDPFTTYIPYFLCLSLHLSYNNILVKLRVAADRMIFHTSPYKNDVQEVPRNKKC